MQDQRSQVMHANNGTTQAHRQTIEHVILTMRSRLTEPLSLHDLADIAYLSPYHFCRVFHRLTGVPPGEFLTALRLEAAKRLLLTTSMSVTDICFEVGYNSLGSFTTRFTRLVGISPGHLRQLGRMVSPQLSSFGSFNFCHITYTHCFAGRVYGPPDFTGYIFVGLFPRPIPQGKPVARLALAAPGRYLMTLVPDGIYYILTAAFPVLSDGPSYLLSSQQMLVGTGQEPIMMHHGKMQGLADIVLRPSRLTDPPVLAALPCLNYMYM